MQTSRQKIIIIIIKSISVLIITFMMNYMLYVKNSTKLKCICMFVIDTFNFVCRDECTDS